MAYVLLSTDARVQHCFLCSWSRYKRSAPWRSEATALAVRRPFSGRKTSTESDAFASHITVPCFTDIPASLLKIRGSSISQSAEKNTNIYSEYNWCNCSEHCLVHTFCRTGSHLQNNFTVRVRTQLTCS